MGKPLLSVSMITYNHEKYLEKAIDSILEQQTNFEYEIVIGDDHSTDNTIDIIKQYVAKYPDKIRPIYRKENVGVKVNFSDTIFRCQGKYVAILEGDDYWTDSLKLQKQVDFLESHPTYSLTSTRYSIHNCNTNEIIEDPLSALFESNPGGIEINIQMYFSYWITKTLTVIFKRDLFDIKEVAKYAYFRDTHLFYHLLKKGNGYCFNFVTGTYNIHDTGYWSSQSNNMMLQTAYTVFNELYKWNSNDIEVKKIYIATLNQYINLQIGKSKRPIINLFIYRYVFKYLLVIKSFKFLKDKINFMYSSSFKSIQI